MKLIIFLFLIVPNALASEIVPFTIPNLLSATEIKYDLPKGLLHAVVRVESGNNHKAFVKHDGKSGLSSYGLMQIQMASAKSVGFKGTSAQLMTPVNNIEYGARYLKWLMNTNGNNVSLALTCYNAGPYSYACRNKKYGRYVGLVLNHWIKREK